MSSGTRVGVSLLRTSPRKYAGRTAQQIKHQDDAEYDGAHVEDEHAADHRWVPGIVHVV